MLRSKLAENCLWHERRPGAPAWKVWFLPWRYLSKNLYTEAGERALRNSNRFLGWALLLAVCAVLVRAL